MEARRLPQAKQSIYRLLEISDYKKGGRLLDELANNVFALADHGELVIDHGFEE